jgi:hypothetical protein
VENGCHTVTKERRTASTPTVLREHCCSLWFVPRERSRVKLEPAAIERRKPDNHPNVRVHYEYTLRYAKNPARQASTWSTPTRYAPRRLARGRPHRRRGPCLQRSGFRVARREEEESSSALHLHLRPDRHFEKGRHDKHLPGRTSSPALTARASTNTRGMPTVTGAPHVLPSCCRWGSLRLGRSARRVSAPSFPTDRRLPKESS